MWKLVALVVAAALAGITSAMAGTTLDVGKSVLVAQLRPRSEGRPVTSQGHPYAIFRRAIDTGNVIAAEAAAVEPRGLSLGDALDLTALVTLHERAGGGRFAVGWLRLWIEESPGEALRVASPCAEELKWRAADLALVAGIGATELGRSPLWRSSTRGVRLRPG
jgi:hypothetical protein